MNHKRYTLRQRRDLIEGIKTFLFEFLVAILLVIGMTATFCYIAGYRLVYFMPDYTPDNIQNIREVLRGDLEPQYIEIY